MLDISNEIQKTKATKDPSHQLIFLAEKIEDGYQ